MAKVIIEIPDYELGYLEEFFSYVKEEFNTIQLTAGEHTSNRNSQAEFDMLSIKLEA
jgi:hypothetical protein